MGLTLAVSKHHKEDELPRCGLHCLCVNLLLLELVNGYRHTSSYPTPETIYATMPRFSWLTTMTVHAASSPELEDCARLTVGRAPTSAPEL